MPEEGMTWLPRDEVLTFEELERVARLARRALRLRLDPPHRRRADRAGPPARAGRAAGRASPRRPGPDHQRRHAPRRRPPTCAAAGLRRVNISLDSLRPRPLRRAHPARRARRTCSTASTPPSRPGSTPVKVNVVVHARGERRRGRRPRRASAATGASRCASSSSCRSTAGSTWARRPGRRRRREILERDRRRVPARAGRPRATSRPSASATSTAAARSG